MFAIPWHGHALVGTTDTPIPEASLEPRPLKGEIELILETAGNYLSRRPGRADILSAFTGIRPLVRADRVASTAALSREHTITISKSGLLTIAGGKWTTYRKMAQDGVDHAAVLAGLEERPCVTRDLPIHGCRKEDAKDKNLAVYGSDAPALEQLMRDQPALAEPLHPALPICGAQVLWAVREEMSRTLDDVLARRTRALFLNARAAVTMAPAVARLMAGELSRGQSWQDRQLVEFNEIATHFIVTPTQEL
jgi:glycerol-3-phosphate dehydrogenase